jgi:hypothetical protein
VLSRDERDTNTEIKRDNVMGSSETKRDKEYYRHILYMEKYILIEEQGETEGQRVGERKETRSGWKAKHVCLKMRI